MKRRLAQRIVQLRTLLFLLTLLAAGYCAALIPRTKINYDLNQYLAEDTMTKRALSVMQEEFGSSEQLRIMFEGISEREARACLSQLKALPQIKLASYDGEEGVKTREGKTCRLITLNLDECDETALVREIREMFPEYVHYIGGAAALRLDLQQRVAEEIPLVMAISLAVVILVLLFTSRAWLEPLAILFVLAVCILLNLGTNFVFPDVSFITFAVSPILQLALSIDYAIMLLHTYDGHLDAEGDPKAAMVLALSECFMPIAASALTTVAGLLSLTFMSFKIGFDIGVVLSKGILLSMFGVFLLMPAVILLLSRPLRATRHRPVRLPGGLLGRGVYKGRFLIGLGLAAAVFLGAVWQSRNTYLFTDAGQTKTGESHAIDEVFGDSNPLVFLVPGGDREEEYKRQRDLLAALETLRLEDGTPAVGEAAGMVTTAKDALRVVTPREVAESTGLGEGSVRLYFSAHGFGDSARVLDLVQSSGLKLIASLGSYATRNDELVKIQDELDLARVVFLGKKYDRILLDLNIPMSDPKLSRTMNQILAEADRVYGEEYFVTGMPMSNTDIGNAFAGDLRKVNLLTFLSILLIVTLSFASLRLALLLVFVIEGAIWIAMGISRLQGEPIFFMSYLICLSIQMGATIDYGILLTSQYRALRREGLEKGEAMEKALEKALPTVLTSGAILVTAGCIIGRKCSVYYISSIGSLLSRGALISVLLVLTLLPALLGCLDRRVIKKKRSSMA